MDLKHLIPHQRRRESGPALDLRFATDKTLTARVGPTPVFTRASGATFVDSDGLVKFAPENLVINSQNFSNNSWLTFGNVRKIRTSTVPDPSGTLSAYEINVGTIGGNGLIFHQYSTAFQAARCTYSVWVRSVSETSDFSIRNYNGSTSVSSGDLTATTTWTRFQFTFTDLIYQFQIAAVSSSAVGNILVWGAQAERSGTARTYIPTTSAALYRPRFDHDPVTLVCRGLLVEDSRTNLYARSQEFDNAAWDKIRSSIQANAINAVDGTLTADKLIEDTSLGTHVTVRPVAPPATAHTLSVFAKKGERDWIVLRAGGQNTFFNLDTGVATSNINSPTITNYGNGWYRCTVTSSAGTQNQIWMSSDGVTTSYTGDGTSGIYIWGAQLEVGLFATSYIPTVTNTVARSADVCSITGTAFSRIYNQAEGTLFADVKPQLADQNAFFFCVNTTASNNMHCICKTNASLSGGKRWAGLTNLVGLNIQSLILTPTDAAISRSRLAYAYKLNDFAFANSGSIVGTDTNAMLPAPTAMRIGARDDGFSINGHLGSIRYYPKRIVDSSLQALTAIVTNTITYNGVQIQYNSSDNGLQITD